MRVKPYIVLHWASLIVAIQNLHIQKLNKKILLYKSQCFSIKIIVKCMEKYDLAANRVIIQLDS